MAKRENPFDPPLYQMPPSHLLIHHSRIIQTKLMTSTFPHGSQELILLGGKMSEKKGQTSIVLIITSFSLTKLMTSTFPHGSQELILLGGKMSEKKGQTSIVLIITSFSNLIGGGGGIPDFHDLCIPGKAPVHCYQPSL